MILYLRYICGHVSVSVSEIHFNVSYSAPMIGQNPLILTVTQLVCLSMVAPTAAICHSILIKKISSVARSTKVRSSLFGSKPDDSVKLADPENHT